MIWFMGTAHDSTPPCFAWFLSSQIKILILISNCSFMTHQFILSLDFFDLFFMFHVHAGSFFKQDDVWRMKLMAHNETVASICYFFFSLLLFITSTVLNVVMEQRLFGQLWSKQTNFETAKCRDTYLWTVGVDVWTCILKVISVPCWGKLHEAWNRFVRLEQKGVFDS